jgi:hypothetical protein
MAVHPRVITVRRRERLFYVGMAVLFGITVFAGFSRTYFLKAYYGSPKLSLLLHIHGVVFTSWILLFLAQTTLVASRRTDIHRRLGVLGGVLAALVVILGTTTAILRVKGGAAPIPGVSPLSFLAIPLFDMVVFAALVGAALYFRHRADVHKRLMTLATISLLSAPIARLPFALLRAGPPAFFGLTDLFILACIVYDLATRRRVHPATIWGGLLIVASQPLRLMISGTPAWLAFASWITQ